MRQLHTLQHTQQMLHLQLLTQLHLKQEHLQKLENGIYYVRGQFVRVAEQTHVLSATSTTPDARVGFTITETLITPESDSSLTDNATGSANYAKRCSQIKNRTYSYKSCRGFNC